MRSLVIMAVQPAGSDNASRRLMPIRTDPKLLTTNQVEANR